MTDRVSVEAPAKVNLYLRVLHCRADGFHELETIFQSVSLADEVVVEMGGQGVDLVVVGAELGAPEENLAFRAAARFREAFAVDAGVRIRLNKHIPAGAGLGGGSSDAAAVLRCLRELTGAGDEGALHDLACDLGSDVPFFLGESPLALGRGRGEVLEMLPALPEAHLVLVMPPVHVATAEAYRTLGRSADVVHGAEAAGEANAVRTWADVEAWMHNDFQDVVAAAHESVAASLQALRDENALVALLSGSGAASFGLFRSRAEAEKAATAVAERLSYPCVAVRTLGRPPSVRRVG